MGNPDLKRLADQARSLVMVDEETTRLFGGVPFSGDLVREMRNFRDFKENGLPGRQRVALGRPAFDNSGRVIGYVAFTVMQGASLTDYERKHITGLSAPLDYVQLKKIVVHPDFRGEGVASDLLRTGLDLADDLDKRSVADVKQENDRVIAFLGKHGLEPGFEWTTPQDTPMYRMSD